MRPQFSIAIVATFATLVAMCVARLPLMLFLFVLQAVIILVLVEVLISYMPVQLRESSEVNCLRMNGSWSAHRAAKEGRARRRMRFDLMAVLLLVALAGNGLAFFVNEFIPIPLAAKAMQAYDPDPMVWKQNLSNQRVDREFEQWSVEQAPFDRANVKPRQALLWAAWPTVLFAGFLWLWGSYVFVRRSYLSILSEFALGVSKRTELNLNRDITRLQTAHDVR